MLAPEDSRVDTVTLVMQWCSIAIHHWYTGSQDNTGQLLQCTYKGTQLRTQELQSWQSDNYYANKGYDKSASSQQDDNN